MFFDYSCESRQDARWQEQIRPDVQARPGAEAADDEAETAGAADDTRYPRRPEQLSGRGHAFPPHQARDPDPAGLVAHLLAGLLAVARGCRGGSRYDPGRLRIRGKSRIIFSFNSMINVLEPMDILTRAFSERTAPADSAVDAGHALLGDEQQRRRSPPRRTGQQSSGRQQTLAGELDDAQSQGLRRELRASRGSPTRPAGALGPASRANRWTGKRRRARRSTASRPARRHEN